MCWPCARRPLARLKALLAHITQARILFVTFVHPSRCALTWCFLMIWCYQAHNRLRSKPVCLLPSSCVMFCLDSSVLFPDAALRCPQHLAMQMPSADEPGRKNVRRTARVRAQIGIQQGNEMSLAGVTMRFSWARVYVSCDGNMQSYYQETDLAWDFWSSIPTDSPWLIVGATGIDKYQVRTVFIFSKCFGVF